MTHEVPSAEPRSSRGLRTFLLVLTATFLCQAAWVLVVPPFRGMDEHEHANKAAAVAGGDWGWQHEASPQGWGSFVEVPSSLPLAAAPICEDLPYTTSDNCRGVDLGGGRTSIASSASQYNPVFYGLVGAVGEHSTGARSLYAMRIATALLCSLLLAGAATVLAKWATTPWPAAALLLVSTPVMLYSTAVVAPNGVEMAAAALVWCALLGVARSGAGHSATRDRLLITAAVGAVPLVSVRSLGPLWLALIVATCATLVPRADWRPLLHSRVLWLCCTVIAACTAAAAGWTLAAGANGLSDGTEFTDSPWPMMPQLEVLWLLQSIAAFPARDELSPLPLYALVVVVWWAFLAVATRVGTARERLSGVVAILLSLLVPAVMTAVTYSSEGTVWQGRYGYPYALGVLLLCGFVLDRAKKRTRWSAAVLGTCAAAWVAAQLIGQLWVLASQRRTSPLAGTSAWWEPHPVVVVALTSGAGLLFTLHLLAGRSDRPASERSLADDRVALRPAGRM